MSAAFQWFQLIFYGSIMYKHTKYIICNTSVYMLVSLCMCMCICAVMPG